MGAEPQQSSKVCRHCMVGKEARDDLLEPLPLFGDRPVHTPSQFPFDLLEFRCHAIAPGLPMDQERSSTCRAADQSKACQIASKCDPLFAAKNDPFDGAETGGAEPHIAEQSRSWRAAS